MCGAGISVTVCFSGICVLRVCIRVLRVCVCVLRVCIRVGGVCIRVGGVCIRVCGVGDCALTSKVQRRLAFAFAVLAC